MLVFLIFLALCAISIVQILQYLYRRYKLVELIDRIPGPKSYPIVGNALSFLNIPPSQRLIFGEEYHKKYGDIFRFWLGMTPVVVITTAEHAEVILTSRKHINKSSEYKFFEPWLGTGLVISGGTKWHSRRKLLTPAFHFSILESFFDIFVKNSSILNRILEKELDSDRFDIFHYISRCTLDIICETAMGVQINAQTEDNEYVSSIKKINHMVINRFLKPWLSPDIIFYLTPYYKEQQKILDVLHGMTSKVIQEKKRRISTTSDNETNVSDDGIHKKKAFLDILIEAGDQLSDSDIREEVDTFMFEGHDTTASALSFAIFMLALHQDIQENAYQELLSVFGTSDRAMTMNDATQLKYLECVIKETLRLFPSVPMIGRSLFEDVKLGEYVVPAGAVVEINFYRLHRDPKQFPNPEVFNPSNFEQENVLNRHSFSFVPFSAGPRNCIGQKFAMLEEKIILSTLLRKYKFESVEKLEDMKIVPETILRSENGINIRISKRVEF